MLFDLRSRGRRRTVRVIYVGLALLMLSGLVLFGVGTGVGGGLLTALTNNTGSGGGNSALNSQVKADVKATERDPSSTAAWKNLINARWSDAASGSNYDSSTDTYTASGKKELSLLGQDFAKYSALVKTPALEVSTLSAEAYGYLGEFKNEGDSWQDVIAVSPNQASAYTCLSASAYAGGQTATAGLAAAKAVSLAPKLQRTDLKKEFADMKKESTVAQAYADGNPELDSGC